MAIKKTYTNGEVTVHWEPEKCIHSANCVKNLPRVFNPKRKPWVDAEAGSTQEIVDTIKKCPSGALTYSMNADNA